MIYPKGACYIHCLVLVFQQDQSQLVYLPNFSPALGPDAHPAHTSSPHF